MQVDNLNVGNSNNPNGGRNRLADWMEKYLSGGIDRNGGVRPGAASRIVIPTEVNTNPVNPRNDTDIINYLWGNELDINARTIESGLVSQGNKLRKASEYYDNRIGELNDWIHTEAPMRSVDDDQVVDNEKYRWLARKSQDFYSHEIAFQDRVTESLKNISLQDAETSKFLEHFNMLDNLRDDYDRVLQDKDVVNRLNYGQTGYIRRLELEKSKDVIENVLLKGGTAADAELYETVYDDEIEAVTKMQEAYDTGNTELAKFWDLIAGKAKEMRVEFLNRLMDRQADPDENPADVQASKNLFKNNYSVLMGRVKDSMLSAIEAGSTMDQLQTTKANASSNFFMREEFDLITTDLADHAINNRSIAQIMTERAKKIFDHDRDEMFEDHEVVDLMLDSEKAMSLYENQAIYDANFDIDNDGDVDAVDINYLRTTMQESNKLFAILDKTKNTIDADGNKIVSPAEILDAFVKFGDAVKHSSNPSAENLVFDFNEDGKIDYAGDFKILQKFLLHNNGTSSSVDENSGVNVLLSTLESIKGLVDSNIDFANSASDNFDSIEGLNPSQRKAFDLDVRRGGNLQLRNESIANHLAYQAYVLAVNPNRLPAGSEKEQLYIDRLNSYNTLNSEYSDKYSAGESYLKVSRPVSWGAWKDRLAVTILVQRPGDADDVQEMDRISDMVMMLDTDMYNYRNGYNTDINRFLNDENETTSTNPNKLKNGVLADMSAQHYTALYKLVDLKTNNVGKVDNDFFNAEFDKLMELHEAVETALLARAGEAGLSLNDPAITALNESFFQQQERMVGVIKGLITN